jgi:hypothetical protein
MDVSTNTKEGRLIRKQPTNISRSGGSGSSTSGGGGSSSNSGGGGGGGGWLDWVGGLFVGSTNTGATTADRIALKRAKIKADKLAKQQRGE